MQGESVVTKLAEQFQPSSTIRVAYGEPIHMNGRTIVPVANVWYGFSGGGGSGHGPAEKGEGGGGGVRVKPIGVIEITDSSTRFVPVVDVGRMALYGLIGLFFVTGVMRSFVRYLEKGRRSRNQDVCPSTSSGRADFRRVSKLVCQRISDGLTDSFKRRVTER